MPDLYQLRVVLRNVSPLIWRRLLVRTDTNIAQLHAVLQTAMGWSDTHLHRFRIHGKAYSIARCGGIGFADDPFEVRLSDFRLRRGERFLYEYDFMDGWVVDIRLEETLAADTEGISPRCTAGRRAAPPEDCGGSWAYLSELDGHKTPPWEALEQVAAAVQRFLDTGDRAVLDDEDEFGQAINCLEAYTRFQPEHFDRKEINAQLRGLAKSAGGAA
jgi:hypothetical protein